MLQDTDANLIRIILSSVSFEEMKFNLIQVLDEAIEDGNKVLGGDIRAKDNRELVDRVGQCSPHLPLHVVCQGLVGFLRKLSG